MPLFCCLLWLWTPWAFAKRVEIYASPGLFSEHLILEPVSQFIDIRAGDEVAFSDGRHFVVHAILGGRSHWIFDVGEGRALRVPKYKTDFAQRLLRSFGEGYAPLSEAGIPLPKILGAFADEYVLIEKIPIRFRLIDWRVQSQADREQSLAALPDFVRRTAGFAYIGDFGAGQIAWSGDSWVLLDWTRAHKYWSEDPSQHPFIASMPSLPPALREIILRTIEAERCAIALRVP